MKKKIFSMILVVAMLLSNNMPVLALTSDTYTIDEQLYEIEENVKTYDYNGKILLVENLVFDGEDYSFIHIENEEQKIILVTGHENFVIVNNLKTDDLLLYNEDSFAPQRFSYEPNKYYEWINIPTSTKKVSWAAGTSAAVIAGILASATGGVASIFLNVAGILAGSMIGCTIVSSGRYMVTREKTYVQMQYKIYEPNGKYITTVHWAQ